MGKRQAQAHILRKTDALKLQQEAPPRTAYVWVDRSMGAKYLDFNTVDLLPGQYTPDHVHDVAEEVVFVHRGRGVFFIEGQEFEIEEGMVIFIPPGVRHHSHNTGDGVLTNACAFAPAGKEALFRMRDKGAEQ